MYVCVRSSGTIGYRTRVSMASFFFFFYTCVAVRLVDDDGTCRTHGILWCAKSAGIGGGGGSGGTYSNNLRIHITVAACRRRRRRAVSL